jgi:hypothetical protein
MVLTFSIAVFSFKFTDIRVVKTDIIRTDANGKVQVRHNFVTSLRQLLHFLQTAPAEEIERPPHSAEAKEQPLRPLPGKEEVDVKPAPGQQEQVVKPKSPKFSGTRSKQILESEISLFRS